MINSWILVRHSVPLPSSRLVVNLCWYGCQAEISKSSSRPPRWILVPEVQVVSGMTECGGTFMTSGQGYVFIFSDADQKMSGIDISDLGHITITETDLAFVPNSATVAGVPLGYSCAPPSMPLETNVTGTSGWLTLALDEIEVVPPFSSSLLLFRADLAAALAVPLNRVFVTNMVEDGDWTRIEVTFTEPDKVAVNQDSAKSLKVRLGSLVRDTQSSLFALESNTVTIVAQEGFIDSLPETKDDKPSAGAVVVAVVASVMVMTLALLAFFASRRGPKRTDVAHLQKSDEGLPA